MKNMMLLDITQVIKEMVNIQGSSIPSMARLMLKYPEIVMVILNNKLFPHIIEELMI